MARPRKEGLDYFPHDVYASIDEKLEAFEALYGFEAYAFYFKVLERVYSAGGYWDVSASETLQIFGRNRMHYPAETALSRCEELLGAAVRFSLFDKKLHIARKIITSEGVLKRVYEVEKRRLKSRTPEFHPHNGRVSDPVSAAETPQECLKGKERKGKERKEKERKEKERKDHSLPSEIGTPDPEPKPPPEPLTKYGTILAMTETEMAKCVEKYGRALVDQEKPEADLWLQKAETPRARKYREPGYNHYLFFRTTWLADKRLKPPSTSGGYDQRTFEETSRRWLEKDATNG